MLLLVAVVDDPKPMRGLCAQVIAVASPRGVYEFSVCSVFCRQIKRVEDERLSLRVEGPSECLFRPALPVSVNNVHDVQIACAHDVTDFAACREHFPLTL